MNSKTLQTFALIAAVIIIILNYKMLPFMQVGDYPPEGELYTSVLLSLLPGALMVLAVKFVGKSNKFFKTMIGVLAMTYALSFIADPWSVSLRMGMGLDIYPMMVYTIIGSVFLFIAIYAFKGIRS